MGSIRYGHVFGAVALAVVLFAGAQQAAGAAEDRGWPLNGEAAVLVAFAERYVAPDGSQATHRGVDLEAAAGSQVNSVLAGTVTFAGRVPAGEGATTLAVTIRTGEVRVTLMPLAEVVVDAGQQVERGQQIGVLAGSGGRSHATSHLHVGVRRGTLYVDPAAFLVLPPVASAPTPPEDVTVPVSSGVPAPSQAPVAAVGAPITPSPVAAPVPASQPSAYTGPRIITVPGPVSGAVEADRAPQLAPSTESVRAAETAAGGTRSSTAEVIDVQPAPVVAAADVLGLNPELVGGALATDKREQALPASPLARAAVFGATALAAVVLLSPVWRSVPFPQPGVVPVREDVAAVVSR